MDIFLTVLGIAVGSLALFFCGSAFVGGLWRHEEEIGGFHETVQPAKAGLAEKRSYRRAA
ncbi:MAG: hypothetical protein ABIF82_07950 [Planctomycetota bacterium]